jgi:hypothetical protein
MFVLEVLQELEEGANEEENEIDEDLLHKKAMQEAKNRFDFHFRTPLMALPHPPKAVLELYDSKSSLAVPIRCQSLVNLAHKATSDRPLAKLVRETMRALQDTNQPELGFLFASAQTVDLNVKLEISLRYVHDD